MKSVLFVAALLFTATAAHAQQPVSHGTCSGRRTGCEATCKVHTSGATCPMNCATMFDHCMKTGEWISRGHSIHLERR